VKKLLSNFWEILLAVFVVVLCIGVFMQVVLRYVLMVSFPAIEEIVGISFIYTIFLGAGVGMKHMEHMNIDLLIKHVSLGTQKILRIISLAGTAVFLFFVGEEGIGFFRESYTQTTTYLNMPMSYFYAALPGSAFIMLYYVIKQAWVLIRSGDAKAGVGKE
jgi:TRAP-type C4-dicarboxylate transport system permease small subunit